MTVATRFCQVSVRALVVQHEDDDPIHRMGEGMAVDLDVRPPCLEAISVAEDSELLVETLGEHVFDFFLHNKRSEWHDYRTQVSAFERDRMLPVL